MSTYWIVAVAARGQWLVTGLAVILFISAAGDGNKSPCFEVDLYERTSSPLTHFSSSRRNVGGYVLCA